MPRDSDNATEKLLSLVRVLAAVGASPPGSGDGSPLSAARPSADSLAAESIRRLGLQASLPGSLPSEPTAWWSVPLSWWLLFAAVLAVVVLLAYLLRDVRWRPRGGVGVPDLPPDAQTAGQPLHLARAQHFATQGRFAEAMHELLLQGLAEMRARAGGHLADSLTSREVLRATRLPEQGRAALQAMIAQVEWTWFGDHEADPDDYHACQASLEGLRAALRQPA